MAQMWLARQPPPATPSPWRTSPPPLPGWPGAGPAAPPHAQQLLLRYAPAPACVNQGQRSVRGRCGRRWCKEGMGHEDWQQEHGSATHASSLSKQCRFMRLHRINAALPKALSQEGHPTLAHALVHAHTPAERQRCSTCACAAAPPSPLRRSAAGRPAPRSSPWSCP